MMLVAEMPNFASRNGVIGCGTDLIRTIDELDGSDLDPGWLTRPSFDLN